MEFPNWVQVKEKHFLLSIRKLALTARLLTIVTNQPSVPSPSRRVANRSI